MTSTVDYLGNLRTSCTHQLSGTTIFTDAPKDNQGKGEAFSPTDLVATALASCMITIMGISANNHNIDITGLKAEVKKVMSSNPRKIAQVDIKLIFPPYKYTKKDKKILESAALSCPVGLSLNDDLIQNIDFVYGTA